MDISDDDFELVHTDFETKDLVQACLENSDEFQEGWNVLVADMELPQSLLSLSDPSERAKKLIHEIGFENMISLIPYLRIRDLNKCANEVVNQIAAEITENSLIFVQTSTPEAIHFFRGRKQDGLQLYRLLKKVNWTWTEPSAKEVQNVICVTGPSGIGKTEFMKRFKKWISEWMDGNCFWLNGQDPETLKSGFIELAQKKLNVQTLTKNGQSYRPIKDIVNDVYDTCRLRRAKSLFILDNVDSGQINDFLPNAELFPPSAIFPLVILTSRQLNWPEGKFTVFPLGLLAKEDAISYLNLSLETISTKTPETIELLAETLGYFPLALFWVAGYFQVLRRTERLLDISSHREQCIILKFLKDYNSKEFHQLPKTESLLRTWSLLLENLCQKENEHDFIPTILSVISYSAPNSIPLFLFKDIPNYVEEEVSNALEILIDAHIIQVNSTSAGTGSIHRLIQKIIRSQIPKIIHPMTLTESLSSICTLIKPHLVHFVSNITSKPNFEKLDQAILPTCRNISTYILENALIKDLEYSWFLHRIWYTTFLLFRKEDAFKLSTEVRKKIHELDTIDPQIWLLWEGNYGVSLTSQHKKVEAANIYLNNEECLKKFKELNLYTAAKNQLGFPHEVSLLLGNGLANFYTENGRLQDSLGTYMEIMEYFEGLKISHHLSYYYGLVGVALVRTMLGKFDEVTSKLYDRAISCATMEFGGEWSVQATVAKYLKANFLFRLGKKDEAYKLASEVLEVLHQGFGTSHLLSVNVQSLLCQIMCVMSSKDDVRRAKERLESILQNPENQLNTKDTAYLRLCETMAKMTIKSEPNPAEIDQTERKLKEILQTQETELKYDPSSHQNVLETKTTLVHTLLLKDDKAQGKAALRNLVKEKVLVFGEESAPVKELLDLMKSLNMSDDDDPCECSGSGAKTTASVIAPVNTTATKPWPCPGDGSSPCSHSYSHKRGLGRHIKNKHPSLGYKHGVNYLCKCSKTFDDKYVFRTHINSKLHPDEHGDALGALDNQN